MHTLAIPTSSLRLLLFYSNHYDTLSVSKDASQKEIRARYYELAKKSHPDSIKGNSEQFLKIKQAYDVLSDQQKKKAYDNGNEGGFTIHNQDTFSGHSYQYYRSSNPNRDYEKWVYTPEKQDPNPYHVLLKIFAALVVIYLLVRPSSEPLDHYSPFANLRKRRNESRIYRREIEEKQIHGRIVDVMILSEKPNNKNKDGMGASNFITLRDYDLLSE